MKIQIWKDEIKAFVNGLDKPFRINDIQYSTIYLTVKQVNNKTDLDYKDIDNNTLHLRFNKGAHALIFSTFPLFKNIDGIRISGRDLYCDLPIPEQISITNIDPNHDGYIKLEVTVN